MLFMTFAQKGAKYPLLGAQKPFEQSGGPLSKKLPDIPTLSTIEVYKLPKR